MDKSQRRYTDSELLTLLQVLASDYGKRPTHREILKDERLPTHHTYIRRFGSLEEAFDQAGLKEMELDNTVHDAIKLLLGDDAEEWVEVGSIIADFKVKRGDKEIFIDVVCLGGVSDEINDNVRAFRRLVAESQLQDSSDYVQICELQDFIDWNQ